MSEINEITNVCEKFARKLWIEKNTNAIDDYLHPNIAIHSPLGNLFGHEAMKNIVKAWITAFPDLSVKHLHIICEDDLTVIHWEAEGTHQGVFKGIEPTGRHVSYSGVSMYRTSQDKIIEYWGYLDINHIFMQIGSFTQTH